MKNYRHYKKQIHRLEQKGHRGLADIADDMRDLLNEVVRLRRNMIAATEVLYGGLAYDVDDNGQKLFYTDMCGDRNDPSLSTHDDFI
jgi:hypothetical protein